MELRVGNRYRLGRKIGSGSFGDIYLGEEGGSPGTCLGDLWRPSGAGPGRWSPSCPFLPPVGMSWEQLPEARFTLARARVTLVS